MTGRRPGAPTKAERRARRIQRAYDALDEALPQILEEVIMLIRDSSTAPGVRVQLGQTVERLVAMMPPRPEPEIEPLTPARAVSLLDALAQDVELGAIPLRDLVPGNRTLLAQLFEEGAYGPTLCGRFVKRLEKIRAMNLDKSDAGPGPVFPTGDGAEASAANAEDAPSPVPDSRDDEAMRWWSRRPKLPERRGLTEREIQATRWPADRHAPERF